MRSMQARCDAGDDLNGLIVAQVCVQKGLAGAIHQDRITVTRNDPDSAVTSPPFHQVGTGACLLRGGNLEDQQITVPAHRKNRPACARNDLSVGFKLPALAQRDQTGVVHEVRDR